MNASHPAHLRGPVEPLAWVTGAFTASVLLNADRVPAWVPVAAAIFIAWTMAAAWRPERIPKLPGTALRSLFALLLVAAVLAQYRTLNGLSAGTALLIVMGASKLLETRQRRDQYVVIGAALFLLLAACLDRQALLRAPLYLLHVWICCTACAMVSHANTAAQHAQPGGSVQTASRAHAFNSPAALLLAGRALLFSVPFALVLFLFFPRLPGAFWALPRSEAATTGLGDSMSPGSITQLTSSYDIAFRVRFQTRAPAAQDLYWRGPVMHDFDGYTWRRTAGTFYRQRPLAFTGPQYRYQVSLEPSSQRWWFALDIPSARPDGKVFYSDDYELIGSDPVSQSTSYTAVSRTRPQALEALARYAYKRDTRPLPPGNNARTQSFAKALRARLASDGQYVEAVLDFLRQGGFAYSLTPPRLGADSVDDFLFNTRTGFCGHFASAFVTLMRSAGVPAHIVTGYLGGEWNPIGGYFIVRQSDAHAWAEVWLAGRGWTRIDPTAVVEPERLRRGILDLLPNAVSAPERMLHGSPWLNQFMQRWDATNTWWNEHVLQFDYQAQLGILQRLGSQAPQVGQLIWAFAAGLLGWLGWIGWQSGRTAPAWRPDRLARAYGQLCKKIARAGIPRAPHQGPLAYAAAIHGQRPDIGVEVQALLECYARLRFGPEAQAPDPAEINALERRIGRLRIAMRSTAGLEL